MGQLIRHACVSRQDASLGRAVVAHFAELTFFLFVFFLLITRLISDRIEFLLLSLTCIVSSQILVHCQATVY